MDKRIHIHLGDGVYAVDTGVDITLYSENDRGQNWIYMDDETVDALIAFFNQARGANYRNDPVQPPLPLQRMTPLPNQLVWTRTPGGIFKSLYIANEDAPAWFAAYTTLRPVHDIQAWTEVRDWDEPAPGAGSSWYTWEEQ